MADNFQWSRFSQNQSTPDLVNPNSGSNFPPTPPSPPPPQEKRKERQINFKFGLMLAGVIAVILAIPLTVIVSRNVQETRQRAQLNNIGPNDNCKKLFITWSEQISGANSCPQGQKNTNVSSYGVTINVKSNDGKSHKFHYITYKQFCPNGQPNPPCVQSGTLGSPNDATTPKTIVIPVQSPPHGSKCGTYQDDFVITTIDGSATCHYGDPNSNPNGSHNPGGAGFCSTGIACPASTPTPTKSPTPSPTPKPGSSPTPSPTPTSFPSGTPVPTPTPTATVSPTPPSCQANQAVCKWQASDNATSYHYKVIDKGNGGTVVEGDASAPQTSISFPSISGHSYNCSISPVNSCGTGSSGSGDFTCTPTPTSCPAPSTPTNVRITCPNCTGAQN